MERKRYDNLRNSNPALANVISDFWSDMKQNPLKYKGQDAIAVVETGISDIIKNQINDFAAEWCTQRKDIIALLNNFKKGDSISLTTDYDAYKQTHEGVSKLKYNRRIKAAAVELIEKIRPLQDK
ncbi:hypothetical protein SELR_03090 [Selenomonas ruminantium subsp. lactilytica TAM6421]|uniref:Uncharacterized protein n=1 Tax=Selenomonas ruminantium subsp. lactilytica (strain NBRC 103574 / TAM6421) TaxID=927704 RepID=I0GMN0_SELRL|nr:hypothetical protein [Selenomonas ruminantium]BAL82017.1 hypothetical protein SELR_03090 [Selenomonas ruminantium subsp. lactilytica TAM6421]